MAMMHVTEQIRRTSEGRQYLAKGTDGIRGWQPSARNLGRLFGALQITDASHLWRFLAYSEAFSIQVPLLCLVSGKGHLLWNIARIDLGTGTSVVNAPVDD